MAVIVMMKSDTSVIFALIFEYIELFIINLLEVCEIEINIIVDNLEN